MVADPRAEVLYSDQFIEIFWPTNAALNCFCLQLNLLHLLDRAMDAAAQVFISFDEVVNEKSWWTMFRETLELLANSRNAVIATQTRTPSSNNLRDLLRRARSVGVDAAGGNFHAVR